MHKRTTKYLVSCVLVTSGVKRDDKKKRPVVIPYISGFSKELKRTFGGFRIPTYVKPTNICVSCWFTTKIQYGRTNLLAQCIKLAVRNVKLCMLVKLNVH